MKRVNHGLAIMMSLLLFITGFRVCMIANAEETDGAVGTEVNQEKMADEGAAEETVKVFIDDGLLTEGISETTEETKTVEEPEALEKPDSVEKTDSIEESEAPKETESTEKSASTEAPVEKETVDISDDKTSTDETAIDPTRDETAELTEDEAEKKEIQKDQKTISVDVTFKVVNGSWDDGTTADKIVTITGKDGEELKLTADQIPEVGSKPADDSYKSGSWDKTPSIEESLTEATTYIYTYSQKQKAVVVKAPEAKTLYYISEAQ